MGFRHAKAWVDPNLSHDWKDGASDLGQGTSVPIAVTNLPDTNLMPDGNYVLHVEWNIASAGGGTWLTFDGGTQTERLWHRLTAGTGHRQGGALRLRVDKGVGTFMTLQVTTTAVIDLSLRWNYVSPL